MLNQYRERMMLLLSIGVTFGVLIGGTLVGGMLIIDTFSEDNNIPQSTDEFEELINQNETTYAVTYSGTVSETSFNGETIFSGKSEVTDNNLTTIRETDIQESKYTNGTDLVSASSTNNQEWTYSNSTFVGHDELKPDSSTKIAYVDQSNESVFVYEVVVSSTVDEQGEPLIVSILIAYVMAFTLSFLFSIFIAAIIGDTLFVLFGIDRDE